MEILIEMIGFIASSISTKSSSSETSPLHGGGVRGGTGTRCIHMDPMDLLIQPITQATEPGMPTMAITMRRPSIISDMSPRP